MWESYPLYVSALMAGWGAVFGVLLAVTAPDYPREVTVVNTVDGNAWYRGHLADAVQEWNACGARVHLRVVDGQDTLGTPGTITVYRDEAGPYGWWDQDYGYVAVSGGWTRTREVLAHELGHALGLRHGSFTHDGSIMGSDHWVTERDCASLREVY